MSRTRRISQALAGIALATIGVVGLAGTWASGPAFAQSGVADGHEVMEQRMDQCAGMMDSMGGMMNGQGMSNMMRGMHGR